MNAHYRNTGRPARLKNFQTPALDKNDLEELRNLLDHSAERLAEVRKAVTKSEEIPRRMLFNANFELLKVSHNPIINLKGAEVTEFQKLCENSNEEIFTDKYNDDWKIAK